jgi:PleD family two-component response regulator
VSAGVAAFPLHGQNLDQLLAAAGKALYEAKNNGRHQVRPALFNCP